MSAIGGTIRERYGFSLSWTLYLNCIREALAARWFRGQGQGRIIGAAPMVHGIDAQAFREKISGSQWY